MKILNSKIHSALDYVVVIILWSSPTLFGLTGLISTLTYALGGVHLLLTVFTNFEFGLVKIIPLKIHGLIELIVSIVLITSPLYLESFVVSETVMNKFFFAGFGIVVFATWLISDYTETAK